MLRVEEYRGLLLPLLRPLSPRTPEEPVFPWFKVLGFVDEGQYASQDAYAVQGMTFWRSF